MPYRSKLNKLKRLVLRTMEQRLLNQKNSVSINETIITKVSQREFKIVYIPSFVVDTLCTCTYHRRGSMPKALSQFYQSIKDLSLNLL